MGFLFGMGKGAAKIQAKATLDSANMQAASDREVARGAIQSMSTQIAQKRASDVAAESLSRPQEGPTVILSPEQEAGKIDPSTGRRRTRRSGFFSQKPSNNVL